MSGVVRNPEALKYNVSKKLAQLCHVIMLMSTQREDRKLRKEYLYSLYDPQIQKVLQDFSDKMKDMNRQVSTVYDEIQVKTDKLYQAKAQTRITEFKTKIKTIQTQHMKAIDTFIAESTKAQASLDSLTQGMEKREEALDEEIESQKLRMAEKIKHSKEKRDKEIQIVRKETEARENQLKKDFELRKRALTDAFERQKQELQNESSNGLGVEQSLSVYAKSLNPRISTLKVDELKEQLNNVIEQAKTGIQNMKQQVQEFSEESARERREMQRELADKNKELADYEISTRNDEKMMLQEKNQLLERNKKEFEKLNIDRMKLLDTMKADLEQNKGRAALSAKQKDQILEELKSKFERDRESLSSCLVNEESARMKQLRDGEKNIETLAKQNLRAIDEMKSQISKNSEFHASELANMTTELSHNVDELNIQNSTEVTAMRTKLSQSKSTSESQFNQTKVQLEQISNERVEILKSHQETLQEIADLEDKETSQLKEQQTHELTALDASFCADLLNLEKKNALDISERQQRNESEKQNALVVFEYQRKQSIQEIEDRGFDTTGYNQLQEEYKAQLAALQNELAVINPPSVDKDVFKSLNDEIDALVSEKSQNEETIQRSRNLIIEEYKRIQKEEEERHKAAVAPTGSGRARKQVIQALNQGINTVRNERETTIANMQSEADSMNNNHMEIMNKLNSEKAALEDPTEIDNLKTSLCHENQCFMDTTKLDEARQAEVDKFTQSNTEIEESLNQEIQHIKENTKSLIYSFESNVSLAESELQANQNLFMELANQEILALNSHIETKQMRHDESIRELMVRTAGLRDHLSASESEFRKKLNRDFARGENAVNDYQKRHRAELHKLEKDWTGMFGFYDERIEVLTQKVSQLQDAVENRPSRECDLEQIDRLQTTLKTVKMQLGNGLTDLKQYRSMLVDQENQYTKMFGGMPKVGVMTPR